MSRFYATTVAQRITSIRVLTNAYTFSVPVAARWPVQYIAGLAWKLLHKLKALHYHYDTQDCIKTVHIDTDDVMRRLLESKYAVESMLGEGGELLLIGREEFRELMGHADMVTSMQFTAEYTYSRRILGLSVHVIPQMSGLVVLRKRDLG
jgi:hypothetical protein